MLRSETFQTTLVHIPYLFPSFPSLSPVTSFLTARVTPHEKVTAAILFYAVSHLHEGTGKLRKTCADTVGHLIICPQSSSLWKMTSRSAFRCAGRGPAVTHPSTDPAKSSCLTSVIAWHRTPTTHRTLSVISISILQLWLLGYEWKIQVSNK